MLRTLGISWYWAGVIVLAVVTFGLGFMGWREAYPDEFWRNFLRTAQLVFGQANDGEPEDGQVLRDVAGVLAAVVLAAAAIKVVYGVLADRYQRWRISLSRGHTLICGCGDLVRAFAQNEAAHGREAVVVGAAPTDSDASFCAAHGVRLLRGDPRDAETLKAAAIERADRLVAITGNDADNLHIATSARELLAALPAREHPCRAFAAIDDPNLWNEMSRSDSIVRRSANLHFGIFNLDRLVARRFFWDVPLYRYADLRDQPRIHAVFLGFGHMGEALLLQMLRACGYRDLDLPAASILCADADAEENRLRRHCPEIDAVVKLRFYEFDAATVPLDEAFLDDVESRSPVSAVLVSLDGDELALQAAIYARDVMHRSGRWRAPVHLRLRADTGVEELLATHDLSRRFDDVIDAFGSDAENCDFELVDGGLEVTAKRIHEAYTETRNQRLAGDVAAARQESLRSWHDLRETYREANRRAADHIKAKLESAGCHVPPDPELVAPMGFQLARERVVREALAALEHRSWCTGMQLDGWRAAPKRDNRRREHDNLVAYDELSESLKDYDRDQIELLDSALIARRAIDVGAPAIRHDHWIGLIGRNLVDAGNADWASQALCEQVLAKLVSRYEHAHFTVVTPLAPGLDLILTRATLDWLGERGIAHRLLVVEAVPPARMLDDFRDAFEAGSAWNGKPRDGEERWIDDRDSKAGGRARIEAARAQVLASSACEWIIDLIRIDSDYAEQTVRQQGYRRAGDYVGQRAHTLIAATLASAPVRPGGVRETLERRGLALKARYAAWPATTPCSTVVLEVDERDIELLEECEHERGVMA